jgi:sodium/potassium-transporting ATPase subunit alpha
MASIKNMLPDHCHVLRDGKQQDLLGHELVPGDIIIIRLGDKLPADVRFVQVSTDAKFDRSILTGETVPLRAALESTDDNYLETACIGLAGTHCVSGNGIGVVVATGDNSMFGRLAKLTNSPKQGLTTLEKEIYYFVAIIVSIMLLMILVVIIAWAAWLRKDHPDWINVPTLIVDCVSVAVAFIPEGLPIAVTASLTIVANVMKKNSILCKSLKTVETLGSVSVICSDKTGTLTKNQMTVTDCLIDQESMSTSEAVERVSKQLESHQSLAALACAGALCNAAEFDASTNSLPLSERRILGDATDQAILRFSEALGSVSSIREDWRAVYRIPFNSKDKFMVQVSQPAKGSRLVLHIKGAPDILLPRCNHHLGRSGMAEPLNAQQRTTIESMKDQWSREAKRVILLARKYLPASMLQLDSQSVEFEDAVKTEISSNLELLGLVGIVDPPREEIPDVIRTLRTAGIRVNMVTGDFKLTAQAIAAKCGIITWPVNLLDGASDLSRNCSLNPSAVDLPKDKDGSTAANPSRRAIVIDGAELSALTESEWDVLCTYDEIVFARTTPEQKLRIVKELQRRGETVGSKFTVTLSDACTDPS